MRRAQSYRHSSKNLTWSIFSEILPVRFKLTNSNNRNGTFTKNPSCFWNHTHTNVLSIQLILTPGFSYLQTVTQETNLLVLKRSVSEVWMKRSGEWQIHVHLAVFFLRHGTSFWWFYLLDDPFLAESFLFDRLFVEAFDLCPQTFFSCPVESLQRRWECTRPSLNLEEQESNLRVHANKESGIWARRLEQALFSTYLSPWVQSRSTKKDGRLRCWTSGDDYNPLNFGRIEMIGGYYLKVDFIL